MICGVAFLYRHEQTLSRCTQLTFGFQCHLDVDLVAIDFRYLTSDEKGMTQGGWSTQFNAVRGGHCAGWFFQSLLVHNRNRCSPVSMAIKQCADYGKELDNLKKEFEKLEKTLKK